MRIIECDEFDLNMDQQENFVFGRAGNESILIFVFLASDQLVVSAKDIMTNGILIAKASQGEQWLCRLDYFFDSSNEVLLLGYSINRQCISKLYHFHAPSILSETDWCSTPLDVATLRGTFTEFILK